MVGLSNGFQIPPIGLGTFLSTAGSVKSAVESAIKSGYKHIDAASVYQNEREIGEVLKNLFDNNVIKREDIFITSKLWNNSHRADQVLPALQKTLSDLQLNYLDLYLIHWPLAFHPGPNYFPKNETGQIIYDEQTNFTETWKALEECVTKGLIKSIGLSNFNSVQIKEIWDNATIKPAVLQVELHPYLSQRKLVEFCKDLNIVVTGYSPLGSPNRPWGTSTEPVLLEEPIVKELATKYNKTAAQILIRYQIDRGVIPIPKSVTEARIKENFNVFDFKLAEEDINRLYSLDKSYRFFPGLRDVSSRFYPFHVEF